MTFDHVQREGRQPINNACGTLARLSTKSLPMCRLHTTTVQIHFQLSVALADWRLFFPVLAKHPDTPHLPAAPAKSTHAYWQQR